MYAWIQRAKGQAPTGAPSPLLQHLTGEFAPRVAGLWRAPHAVFLTATAERRHLVCIALAQAEGRPLPAPADGLLMKPFNAAARLAMPKPPAGLRRALNRMGETGWSAGDYAALLRLLALEPTAKTLRHAERIEVENVRALALMPEPLLRARVGAFGLNAHQARALAEAYALVCARGGDAAARDATTRWAMARDAKGLFEMVKDDVWAEPPAPPFPGTDRLRPLTTKAAIRDAALRYRNCLRNQVRNALTGDAAYYEWVGEPGAVICLWKDWLYGWKLDEAKLAGNEPIPEPMREVIAAEVRAMGAHVGRAAWRLEDALEEAHEANFVFADQQQDFQDCF